jgi:hypothetical protein
VEDIFLSLYLLRFAGVSPGKRQHSPEKKSPEWFGRERGLSQIGGFAVPRAARKLDLSKALFDWVYWRCTIRGHLPFRHIIPLKSAKPGQAAAFLIFIEQHFSLEAGLKVKIARHQASISQRQKNRILQDYPGPTY